MSLNSIPKIALAPLFIIWMGTGITSKVAVSMLIALFSIVIDTVLGLRSVDPDAIDLSKSLRASPMQILFTIRFPNALPAMFAGMKVAISLALVGAIAGEFVASQVGIGYVILVAQGMFQTTRVFAAILLLGVLGTVLFYIVDMAERLLIPWHVSHRSAQGPRPKSRGPRDARAQRLLLELRSHHAAGRRPGEDRGLRPAFTILGPEQAFARAFTTADFDVSELSLSNHMNALVRGRCGLRRLPVFPSRSFRHSTFYVRTDRGILRRRISRASASACRNTR